MPFHVKLKLCVKRYLGHPSLGLQAPSKQKSSLGEYLKARSEDISLPAALRCVVKADAVNSDVKASKRSSDDFQQLKQTTFLAIGAPVMCTQNYLWDVHVVSLGIMNGARGTVVAILYAPPNANRVNGVPALVGFPSGSRNAPLPNVVVVNFPEYQGRAFFNGCPSTWVPIPASRIQSKMRKSQWRVALPLRLCRALTVHKCQGLTCANGCVVDLAVARPRNPIASLGLAFVAWTRVTTFDKLAFRSLPPLPAFYAVRQSQEFQAREVFESEIADLHEAFLKKTKDMDLEGELQLHIIHNKEKLQQELSTSEISTLREKLFQRGVKQPDAALIGECARMAGLGHGATLAEVARSFQKRSATSVSQGLSRKGAAQSASTCKQSKRKDSTLQQTDALAIELELLLEQGFERDLAEHALTCCSSDVAQAIEFCLAHQSSTAEERQSLETQITAAERALRTQRQWRESRFLDCQPKSGDSAETLKELIASRSAGSSQQWRARAASLCKRRVAIRVASCPGPKAAIIKEYEQRALQRWPGAVWKAVDLGIRAGVHTNACFWLCLAAGLSRCELKDYGSEELHRLHEQARSIPFTDLQRPRTTAVDVVGVVADGLRQCFCGLNGIMFRPDVMAVYAPIFAACNAAYSQWDRPASLEVYKEWITKVARVEFADELIVAAAAKFLNICITTVPRTPVGDSPWVIAQHPEQERWAAEAITEEIVMGNNDVHYVWLCQQP